MNEPRNQMPFGLPNDQAKFDLAIRRRAAWLRKQFGDAIDATSAIQDVLLRYLRKRDDGAELLIQGFWRAVTRVVFDQFRRQRRHERFLAARIAQLAAQMRGSWSKPGSSESEILEDDARLTLKKIVATLSCDDQDLWARLLGGESYSQIAEATQREPSAVKMAAFRLRRRIQNALPHEYQPSRIIPRRVGS